MYKREQELEKLKVSVLSELPHNINDAQIKDVGATIAGEANKYIHFSFNIWGKEINKDLSIPTTAWQRIKKDYAPNWFLRRFPVEHETNEVILRKLWPDIDFDESNVLQISNY